MSALLLQILVGVIVGAFVLFIWWSTRPCRTRVEMRSVAQGSIRYDTQSGKVYIFVNDKWFQLVAAPEMPTHWQEVRR